MGLYIYSLDTLPENVEKDYFIYLLDYGWKEPISEILNDNFEQMAQNAEQNNAVIIKGLQGHFNDEVFSWHNINGIDGNEVLPALLITNQHPMYFRELQFNSSSRIDLYREENANNMKLILIPFRKFCKTDTEVINLIQKVFNDIEARKDISDFQIAREIKKGNILKNSPMDAIILQPNFAGIGVDIKKLIQTFLNKN